MTDRLDKTVDNRLSELEIKVAFLEDTLNKLSDEHYQQQLTISQLQSQQSLIVDKLNEGQSSESGPDFAIDEKPPHY